MEYAIKIDTSDTCKIQHLVREAFESGIQLGMLKAQGQNAQDIQERNNALRTLVERSDSLIQTVADKAFEAGKRISELEL